MELRHLRYFIAVAEHLNFSEASRGLHVAQPAISQTILDLEEELEVKLLLRTRRSVQLTAAGTAFLPEAREIIRRSASAKVAAQRASKGEVGSLSIGFLGSASARFLPDLVEAYTRQFPSVTIKLREMTPEEQLKAFEEKKIDIGFSRPVPKERAKEFHQELIYNDCLQIALPLTHPLVKSKLIDLKKLSLGKFVQFHRSGAPGLFDEVIASCRRANFSPNIIREPEVMSSVMLFVESGLGVSLVPGCVGNLNHPKAILRPIRPASLKIPLCVIWPLSTNTPIIESFLEIVRSAKATIQKSMEK